MSKLDELNKQIVEFRKQQFELRMKLLPFHLLKGKTQVEIVKHHLDYYGEITNEQANLMYGIRHLPKRMEDFKKKFPNYKIVNFPVKGVTWLGDACDWVRYVVVEVTNV